MGNNISNHSDTEWKFVGREKDINNIKSLLLKKRCVQVFGLTKIGKSKTITELLDQLDENYRCILKDFELDDTCDGQIMYEWIADFLTAINADEEKIKFEKKFPLKQIACGRCDECKRNNLDKCIKKIQLIKTSIKIIIDKLNKDDKEVVLFLDNVDTVMDSALKDNFLLVLNHLMKTTTLRIVLTSSIKLKFVCKGFELYELNPLEKRAIKELLFETCERRDVSDDDEAAYTAISYSTNHMVFTEENKPYIKAIVKLCEGLPLAAIMSGLLLTEDEGLLTPADLLEILICMRLKGLSPYNCPPDDRLDIYNRQMEQVQDVASYFNSLNEQLTGNKFSIDMAVEVAKETVEGVETDAMAKQKVLKKCLDRSILSIRKLPEEQQLNWHGILRECQAALMAISNISQDKVSNTQNMVWKFMKENVAKADLDFNEEILRDPKSLENAIKSLSFKEIEIDSPPVQASDEKKRLSISEEHSLATKEQIKTTVMKDVSEKKLYRHLENIPDMSSKDSRKMQYRYQKSQESENDLDFEKKCIIYARQPDDIHIQDTQGTSASEAPPPYTTLPSDIEYNLNQEYNNRVNIVGEPPPPSYHSCTSSQYNNEPNEVTLNDAVNNPEIQTSPLRSRSLSTVCNDKDVKGKNTQQVNKYNEKRRPKSDPTFDRLNITDKTKNVSDWSRKEMDEPKSFSLTGPPALRYIPPEIALNGINHSGRHIPEAGSPNKDTREQTSSFANLQMDSVKEGPFPKNQEASGFSVNSVGPAAMSYKYSENDLKSEQGNNNNLANKELISTDGIHGQNSVNIDIALNNRENGGRLAVKHGGNQTQRRSPTAIVSPMPRRQSPPNVTKQIQSGRPVQSVTPFR